MAFEPRVEDLLATIRLAIDSDINELDRNLPNGTASQSAGLLTRGSIREMRVSYDQPTANVSESIASLRDRVGRQKIENRFSWVDKKYLIGKILELQRKTDDRRRSFLVIYEDGNRIRSLTGRDIPRCPSFTLN